MSNSNNRRSNNRSAGSKPQRRTSDAAKQGQRAGAQRSAMKRASEEAAEAADAVEDAADDAVDAVEEAASEAAEPRTAAAKARRTRSRDADEREPAKRRDAARRDSTPRLPDDDGTPTGRERPVRRSTAGGSSTRSGSKPAAKSPAKQPAKSRRTRPAEPERRSTAARNGDAASTNGSRRTTSARRPDPAAEPAEGRTRRRSKPADADVAERAERPDRSERRNPVQRYEVFYGEADLAERDRSLEALWYEIADQWGPSDVGPIALVPVPPMTTADAARYAERFASIGAAIDGDRVKLITALDLWPSDTTLAREIEQSRSERTAIVLESPSLNPASIPIIRRCTTVVPVVQLGLSQEDEVGQLVAGTGRAPSTTMLCIERPKRRRGLARLRRRPKATAKV